MNPQLDSTSTIVNFFFLISDSRLPPGQQQQQQQVQQQQQQQQQPGMGTLGGGNGVGQTNPQVVNQGQPLVMPGFPMRAATVPHYSPYSPSRFHIDKRCQHRCSWKCFSIAMILVTVALLAMLTYYAGELLLILLFFFHYNHFTLVRFGNWGRGEDYLWCWYTGTFYCDRS